MRRFVSGPLGAGLFSCGLLFLLLSVFSNLALVDVAPARAEEAAPEADAPPADAPPAEAGAKPESAVPEHETMLGWLYRSLGLRYVIIFLFITFNLVALIAMNILGLLRDRIVPETLVQEFQSLLEEKRYQDAYERARGDDSFLGRVLAAGMAKLSAGYDAAIGAMQEVGEEENMKLEHRLSYISLIAQIGPMFGLLGTVDGMVMAFDVIARSNVTPRPSELAQGIGTALVTTVVGLWIAIPSIAYYHIMRNRLTKLVMLVGVTSDAMMKRFAPAAAPAKKG